MVRFSIRTSSRYFPCVRALWSTLCRGERHGVGKGGERGQEQRQERQGKAGGGERDQEQRKEKQVRAGRAAGSGVKRSPMVEDVSDYWEFYEGEGTD